MIPETKNDLPDGTNGIGGDQEEELVNDEQCNLEDTGKIPKLKKARYSWQVKGRRIKTSASLCDESSMQCSSSSDFAPSGTTSEMGIVAKHSQDDSRHSCQTFDDQILQGVSFDHTTTGVQDVKIHDATASHVINEDVQSIGVNIEEIPPVVSSPVITHVNRHLMRAQHDNDVNHILDRIRCLEAVTVSRFEMWQNICISHTVQAHGLRRKRHSIDNPLMVGECSNNDRNSADDHKETSVDASQNSDLVSCLSSSKTMFSNGGKEIPRAERKCSTNFCESSADATKASNVPSVGAVDVSSTSFVLDQAVNAVISERGMYL